MGVYLETAYGASLGRDPSRSKHVVYLSTDDPDAIDVAKTWTPGAHCAGQNTFL